MRTSSDRGVPAPTAPADGTVPALVERAIRERPDATALKCREAAGDRAVTYGELGRLVEALGATLVARGLPAGGRVALLAENGPEWAIAYLAALSCGAAIVPLDTQLGENEIRRCLMHCGASFLVVSRATAASFPGGPVHPGVETLVIAGADGDAPRSLAAATAGGERLLASGDRRFHERRAAVRPGDAAAICYTSGTTGQPKGIVLTHRNIAANVESCVRRIPVRSADVFLSILPLHHTFAATANLLVPLSIAAEVFFGRSLKSRDIREDVERERVTIMIGVPLLFDRMAAAFDKRVAELPAARRLLFRTAGAAIDALGRLLRAEFAPRVFRPLRAAAGIGTLRFCISGGAALKDETERTFFSIGLPVLQGYGLTEAAPVVSVTPLGRRRRGTVGPPLPGVEIRIHEPDKEGVGEILVRGPNVMAGYLDDPAATAGVLRDGWLHTGDLGTIGADGCIAVAGRKKSVIVTAGGKNVYPDEIEMRLGRSPFVRECVVLAVRDRRDNERVGAIVVPDYESIAASRGRMTDEEVRALVAAEVRAACAELPEYKRVREIRVRSEEFPKTSTRKVRRHLVTWPVE